MRNDIEDLTERNEDGIRTTNPMQFFLDIVYEIAGLVTETDEERIETHVWEPEILQSDLPYVL